MAGKLIFKPYFIQSGKGPHLADLVYAADENENVFHSDISITPEGIVITNSEGVEKFSIHVRWNIEGFGYIYSIADNEGNFYCIPSSGIEHLNLVYELAKSAVAANDKRINHFISVGWTPDSEITTLHDCSHEFLNKSNNNSNEEEKARLSQKSLCYAHWVADYIEVSRSKFEIKNNSSRKDFLYGCDARGFFQMDSELFLERFSEVFNYATITHYWKADFIDFEPVEGKKNFEARQKVLTSLRNRNIKVAGRPLFWTHFWVTPDWLRNKNFDQLLKYVEQHIKEVVGFYKEEIEVWEVVNELHDWANELELTPDQAVYLTKFACNIARSVNPKIKLLINNCRPFGDYVQLGRWHDKKAKYEQRTPHQFIKDLISAGVDFDIIGLQVYYAYYSAADAIKNIERFKLFNKSVQLSEVGAPSAGIKLEFCDTIPEDLSGVPYDWHRYWDEELQADWLENIFTYAYSQNFIEGANWYDFIDPHSFLIKGGLLKSPDGEKKAAYYRLKKLQSDWKSN
jgi:endo-1,4-beta-xylanase